MTIPLSSPLTLARSALLLIALDELTGGERQSLARMALGLGTDEDVRRVAEMQRRLDGMEDRVSEQRRGA